MTDDCPRHGEAFARRIVEVSLSDQGGVVVDQVVCLRGTGDTRLSTCGRGKYHCDGGLQKRE